MFNQTFYCLNRNQDFKICVTDELRLLRKRKRKGSNKVEKEEVKTNSNNQKYTLPGYLKSGQRRGKTKQ